LALGACSRSDDRTAGEKLDATVARTEQAAAEAKADIKREAGEAKSAVQEKTAELRADASAATDRAKAAGAKSGTAIEQMADKVGDKISDAGITAGVNAELAKDSTLSALRINVDTANGRVSLRGTAPSSQARERATTLAKSVKGVTAVDNQLEVRS
jgi:osmotically-inducible protein OsmY